MPGLHPLMTGQNNTAVKKAQIQVNILAGTVLVRLKGDGRGYQHSQNSRKRPENVAHGILDICINIMSQTLCVYLEMKIQSNKVRKHTFDQ